MNKETILVPRDLRRSERKGDFCPRDGSKLHRTIKEHLTVLECVECKYSAHEYSTETRIDFELARQRRAS